MKRTVLSLRGELLVAVAGAIFPLSLAPFHYQPLALLSVGLLYYFTRQGPTRRIVLRFYLYNLAMFAVGVSWIHVSISEYGGASPGLAALLVGLFVATYSLVSVPQAYVYGRWFRHAGPLLAIFSFCGLWALQEWFRGWFLTGFPWLFVGYGFLGTPFDGYAPFIGVFGVSFFSVLVGCALAGMYLVRNQRRQLVTMMLAAALPLLVAAGLSLVEQTAPGRQINVSLVQGNIDQHVKWRKESVQPILRTYLALSEEEFGRDLVVWPEAAVTLFRDKATGFLDSLARRSAGGTLVLGIPDFDKSGGFRNTVIAVGAGEGRYIKRRLVPFGEYVPLEKLLRGLIAFFDLPMARNSPGPSNQTYLTAGDLALSTSICYEVVYPELVRTSVRNPDLLVTVSNDTWFGASVGPWQHLQMAQMRALENGRSLVRATNNGVTAFIDHRGEVTSSLPRFEKGVLRGRVEIRTGETLFHRYGSYPFLGVCLMILFAAGVRLLGERARPVA